MRWWPIPRHYLSVLDDGTKAFSAPYFSGMQIRRKNSSVTLAPGPLMIPGHNIAEDLEIRDYGRVFPGGGCKVTAMWPVDARVSGGTVLMALLLRAATGMGPTVEAAAVAGRHADSPNSIEVPDRVIHRRDLVPVLPGVGQCFSICFRSEILADGCRQRQAEPRSGVPCEPGKGLPGGDFDGDGFFTCVHTH